MAVTTNTDKRERRVRRTRNKGEEGKLIRRPGDSVSTFWTKQAIRGSRLRPGIRGGTAYNPH